MESILDKVENRGRRAAKIEVATNIIKAGKLTDQEIASACGLELKDVQKLREELTAKV